MKSGKLFFDCCDPSVGNHGTAMNRAERMTPSTVPSDDELHDALHRRSFRTRGTPRILQPRTPVRGTESFVRFATVPPMAMSPSAGLAPIRTKLALPCAFAALITPAL